MSDTQKEVILVLIEEPLFLSIVRDAATVVEVALIIGLGVFLRSSAMQWFGFIACWLMIFSRAARYRKEATRFRGPQRLADELKRRFGVVAQEAVNG